MGNMTDTDQLLERLRTGLGCGYLSDLPSLVATSPGRTALRHQVASISLEDFPDEAWRHAASYLIPGRAFSQGAEARDFLLRLPSR